MGTPDSQNSPSGTAPIFGFCYILGSPLSNTFLSVP